MTIPDLHAVPEPEHPSAALEACLATYRRWLHLPDPGSVLFALASVAANRGPGDPLWSLLIGPPGSGKTESIQPLAALPDVHPAATLTEAALLSGTPKKDTANGAKGGLLRVIGDYGIVLLKDFGSVLSMHRDARSSLLAALREVYDGSWTRHLGTDGGRTLHWEGKVGMIAGCTPAVDSHHAVMSSMGERFALYRLPPVDEAAQAAAALRHIGHEADMRAELAAAVRDVLGAADLEVLGRTAGDDQGRLIDLATLAVRCRSAVERDGYSREIEAIPPPEAPGRLALVLLRLLNGLRAIGADEPAGWRITAKVALDCMPANRRAVLEHLVAAGDTCSTSEVAERLGWPTSTARRALEDLTAHHVLHREKHGEGKADLWNVTDWTRQRWRSVPEVSGEQ